MRWMMKVRNGGRLGVWGRWCTATALALMLAACQTPQPKGLTPHQQQVLRAQGFEPAEQGWELQMPGKLLFEFDSSVLGESARTKVTELARALMKEGIDRLRVEGYTDDRGSDAYNLRLSLRRAQAVADVLAWQLGNNGPVSPLGGRAVRQVLDAAAGAAGCDLNQASRVPAFEGVTAAELARRANVSLPAAGSTR